MQPLVDADLLDMEERLGKCRSSNQYIYTMTEKSLKYTTDEGHFCYGKQTYVRVDGLPEIEGGFKPGQKIPVKAVVKRKVTEDWAKVDVMNHKVNSGEMALPVVLTFKQDGSISVFR